jgi:hypothetical protein
MASSKEWFIASRAENLAIVLLTRFPVTVAREPDIDRGLDLRVIVDPEKPGLREFGVQIKGTTRILEFVDQHHRVRPQILRASRRMLEDCPFPVALMVFDVATDTGLFGWLLAPVIQQGKAGLATSAPVPIESATNERIANALAEVREWYSARPWRIDKAVAHQS